MKKIARHFWTFALSALWTVTVAVNAGTTNVNVSIPDDSFSQLLTTVQTVSTTAVQTTATNTGFWNTDFLTQLFKLF